MQTKLANYATETINKKYGTNINIDRLRVSLISWDTAIKGIYVEDYKKDTLFYVDELKTSILSIGNLAQGRLEFGDIKVNELHFKLKTYYGEQTTNINVFVDKLDSGRPKVPGTPPFFFSSNNIHIAKSKFQNIDNNLESPETLNFKDLNILASDFQILGPEVSVAINNLSFLSKRGLKVDSLKTDFKYTKQQMRFDSLTLKTPLSNVEGNIIFNYYREDFKDFFNKVNVVSNFNESTVSFDEINLLYNEFGKGKSATFTSNINGVLNDLNLDDLFLLSDNTGIRKALLNAQEKHGWKVHIPKFEYCTDNAGMIGIVGYLKFKNGDFVDHDISAKARYTI